VTARDQRAALARETLDIVASGRYFAHDGTTVDISAPVRACVQHTHLLLPEELAQLRQRATALARRPAGAVPTVANETTLASTRRLSDAGHARVGVLNFASARNPGGGFLGGSQAQEESLARSSALYASLTSDAAQEYYAHHRSETSLLYTDRVIVSPACPVFRDDDGRLLATPLAPTFLTCAAPNAGALSEREPSALPRIPGVFAQRAAGVLAAAAEAGCDALVLGAWGCGVFRNDPDMVASSFRALLGPGGEFAGVFAEVRFAVLDTTAQRSCLRAFERAFDRHAAV